MRGMPVGLHREVPASKRLPRRCQKRRRKHGTVEQSLAWRGYRVGDSVLQNFVRRIIFVRPYVFAFLECLQMQGLCNLGKIRDERSEIGSGADEGSKILP